MRDDLRDHLQSSLGSSYTIERELGGGGMSRVFVAEEARLRRKVVVKVLSPELAAGLSADRFEREIIVAAQLSHPSIVPLLTAGDADGVPYYTMPLVEGLSLRARLAGGGPPPIAETVSVLRDVARALAHAHEHGVVHRDIKPENVLLAGDAAVVTDFGIAKAISAARTEAPDVTLTRAGTSIGTPAYMAPEQVTGDPGTDARADLYSFGCLAYEMLTGETPFHGRPVHKLLVAHMGEQPADLYQRRPDAPASLTALVMRCLEKMPDKRPQSAREILQILDASVTTTAERARPAPWVPRRALNIAVAALVVLGALGLWAVLQRGTAGRDDAGAPAAARRSLAVLPFENAGGDTADAYFADGIAEELGTALSKVAGLNVLARSSVSRFRGQVIDSREVGRTLAVGAVVEGTVRRAGQQMRVTARLIDVRDGRVLWSDSYQREVKDVFAVQDEITRAIADALQVQLALGPGGSGAAADANRGTSDLIAYDLYLRGQFLLRRRGPGVRLAAENFEKAIARDSSFARAYSGLSAALELFPYFVGTPAPAVHDRASAAARHALALDSTLAEPHTSLALAHQHAYQWDDAEREFRLALALDTTDAASRHQFGRFLLYKGRTREALTELRKAKAFDPFSAVISGWVAYSLLRLGQADSALAEGKRAMELDSTNAPALGIVAFTRLATGDAAGARAIVDRLPPTLPWLGTIAYLHGATGDQASARRIVRDLEAQRPRPWFAETAIAMGRLGMGDSAAALDALERGTDAREIWPTFWPISDQLYARVHSSPRFGALVRKVGLDVNPFARRQ